MSSTIQVRDRQRAHDYDLELAGLQVTAVCRSCGDNKPAHWAVKVDYLNTGSCAAPMKERRRRFVLLGRGHPARRGGQPAHSASA